MLWLTLALMLTAAALIVAVPPFRVERRLSPRSVLPVVAVTAIAVSVYAFTGSPTAALDEVRERPAAEAAASLAAQLQHDPDDLSGWKAVARLYMQLDRYVDAARAFERAAALESFTDPYTLADLGEAILFSDARTLDGRAGEMFETALRIAPRQPKALFYAGMAAAESGATAVAADRWETLLEVAPPPDAAEAQALREEIARLRAVAADGDVARRPK